jgi:hypothetical protein
MEAKFSSILYRHHPCRFVPFFLTKLRKLDTFDVTFGNTTAASPLLPSVTTTTGAS